MSVDNPVITAVIVSYWPKRQEDLPVIVESLENQSVPPDKIIIMNNGPALPARIGSAITINSNENFHCRSKYIAALMHPSDYYFFLDDDVVPQKRCIEAFLNFADKDCCLSWWGTKMVDNFFSSGTFIKCEDLYQKGSDPVKVDGFIGIVQFCSFNSIVTMLKAEANIRLDPREYIYDGEDIFMGMSNPNAMVIPLSNNLEESAYTLWDHQKDGAMQLDDGYYQARDDFAFKAWISLGNEPFDSPIPEGDAFEAKIKLYKETISGR